MILATGLALLQTAPTVPSHYIVDSGHVYVASPVYVVKPVTPDEIYRFSLDGARLAYVSATTTDSPKALESKIAKGDSPFGAIKVGIWSKDTGRATDVFVPRSLKLGVSAFTFVGHDLVFSTFDETKDGTTYQLWVSRNSGPARSIELQGFKGASRFVVSKTGTAILVPTDQGVWLIDESKSMPIKIDGYTSFVGNGTTAANLGCVWATKKDGTSESLYIDFQTGKVIKPDPRTATPALLEKIKPTVPLPPPFIFDTFKYGGVKDNSFTGEPRTEEIDSVMAPLAQEDGGYRMDVVESEGKSRRRMPFIHEMAGVLSITPDYQTVAFVSNHMLMIRSLVKLSDEASKKILEQR